MGMAEIQALSQRIKQRHDELVEAGAKPAFIVERGAGLITGRDGFNVWEIGIFGTRHWRGHFMDEADAQKYAAKLEEEGGA